MCGISRNRLLTNKTLNVYDDDDDGMFSCIAMFNKSLCIHNCDGIFVQNVNKNLAKRKKREYGCNNSILT